MQGDFSLAAGEPAGDQPGRPGGGFGGPFPEGRPGGLSFADIPGEHSGEEQVGAGELPGHAEPTRG